MNAIFPGESGRSLGGDEVILTQVDLFLAHRSPDEFWGYIIKSGVRSREWEDRIIKTKNIIIAGFENAFRETCKHELLEELGRLAA